MEDQPIRQFFNELRQKIVILLIITLLSASIGLVMSFYSKPSYVGSLTFVLEDGKSNSLGSYASLASQFGIDLSTSAGGAFQGDNILQLLKSRLLIDKALNANFNQKQTIADAYFENSGLKKQFLAIGVSNNILIDTANASNKILRDSIDKIMYEKILQENLVVDKIDKRNSFIKVSFKSPNEKLAKAFPEKLVYEAIAFYVTTKIQRSKLNVDKLQLRADSILYLINNKTYEAAAKQDININPIKKLSSIPLELAVRDKSILLTMYSEVVKNLELAKINLSQETPLVQIVDTPILPLEKVKFRKIEGIFYGGLFGFVIAVSILLILAIAKGIYNKY